MKPVIHSRLPPKPRLARSPSGLTHLALAEDREFSPLPPDTVLSMVAAGYFASVLPRRPNPPHKPVSVLVAEFSNTTAESVFDGTLEPVFMTGMEGVRFVNLFSPSTARSLAKALKPDSSSLNEATARLIATREGINVVLTGLIARQGDGYRVTVNAIDGLTGKTIISRDSATVKKEDVLREIAKMVPDLRRAIGDATPESQQAAAGETFTSTSLAALHDYGAAQQQLWLGNFDEAAKLYLTAVQADPKFGRANAGLAVVNRNLGRSLEAEKYFKLALGQGGFMTEREVLRTRGAYFLMLKDPKAIAEFSDLVKQYPFDTAGQANLALAYCYARDERKAVDEGRKAVELEPRNILRHSNLALYALYAGDTVTAVKEARTALASNPKYLKPYIALALSQVLDGQIDAAIKTYQQLRDVNAVGAAMASTGLADLDMYEGKFSDAAAILERSLAAESDPRSDSAIARLLMLSECQLAQKKTADAVKNAEKAVCSAIPAPLFLARLR